MSDAKVNFVCSLFKEQHVTEVLVLISVKIMHLQKFFETGMELLGIACAYAKKIEVMQVSFLWCEQPLHS